MATESVLVNGRAYDFYATRLEVFGLKLVGYSQIDFGDKIERGEARGPSQVALATTRGKYSADKFKLKLLATSGKELRAHLASKSRTGKSTGQVKGVIVLQLLDDELGVQTTTFGGCRPDVTGTASYGEGTDALMEDWEFYVRTIERDGITQYESDEPGVDGA